MTKLKFSEYLAEINQIKLLTREEEQELWVRYKSYANFEARCALIEQYQPLVVKVISQWTINDANCMDLVQEGTIGLIEAVESFDPFRGVAFSLFAVHRIRGRMLNFFAREKRQTPKAGDSEAFTHRLSDPGPSVSELTESNFLVEQLRHALQRLPNKERVALSGIYIDGTDPGQMARLLCVSPSHISRLQKQGIRRIRGMMSRLIGELKK